MGKGQWEEATFSWRPWMRELPAKYNKFSHPRERWNAAASAVPFQLWHDREGEILAIAA